MLPKRANAAMIALIDFMFLPFLTASYVAVLSLLLKSTNPQATQPQGHHFSYGTNYSVKPAIDNTKAHNTRFSNRAFHSALPGYSCFRMPGIEQGACQHAGNGSF